MSTLGVSECHSCVSMVRVSSSVLGVSCLPIVRGAIRRRPQTRPAKQQSKNRQQSFRENRHGHATYHLAIQQHTNTEGQRDVENPTMTTTSTAPKWFLRLSYRVAVHAIVTVLICVCGVTEAEAGCTDRNCSFNGECRGARAEQERAEHEVFQCLCDPGWTGQYCEQLKLLPPRNGSGLQNMLTGNLTSTWGGSVIYSAQDDQYHMYFSEISRHCGIHRWISNSVVSHAVSAGPQANWTFTKMETLFPLFTHEPIVARASTRPDGPLVLFVTHYPGDASDAPTCNCTDGSSVSGETGCAAEVGVGVNKTLFSFFTWAPRPDGPWSPLISLSSVQPGLNRTDLNLAPVILANDSLVAWTRWDIWRATNWSNSSSYINTGQAPDFNHGATWEGEDPSLWIDRKGRFHMLSHNGARGEGGTAAQPKGDCGRHYYSETGSAGTWEMAPLPLGGCAYPRVNVSFSDGTARSFYRRERPHLILGKDGFSPVALSTAVIDSPNGPSMQHFQPPQRDASYTLVQEIDLRNDIPSEHKQTQPTL